MHARRALMIALAVLLPTMANAQTIPKEKGPKRTIGLFDFLCLKQMPELDLIERAAGFGEFDQLIGEDLKPFTPTFPTEKLFAWRYHDHGERYILVAHRSKPQEAEQQASPAFAHATKTSCSLLVPSEKPDQLLGELTRLVGRAPDKQWRDGDTLGHAWTQQSAEALSNIAYFTPEKTGGRASLTASLFVKK